MLGVRFLSLAPNVLTSRCGRVYLQPQPVLGEMKQGDCEYKASLDHRALVLQVYGSLYSGIAINSHDFLGAHIQYCGYS